MPLRRRPIAAFTTIELTVSMLVMAVIIAALYQFLSFGSRSVSLGSEEIEGVRRANVVMERLKRDLRAICDVVNVPGGKPDVLDDGTGMSFLRFDDNASSPQPRSYKVEFRSEKVKVVRAGQPADAVRLQVFYGNSKAPAVDESLFSDVRFKKYRLNGLPFYQVRLAVPDLTGKSAETHYLQTSVGSRYYHTFYSDPNWLALDETAHAPRGANPSK